MLQVQEIHIIKGNMNVLTLRIFLKKEDNFTSQPAAEGLPGTGLTMT